MGGAHLHTDRLLPLFYSPLTQITFDGHFLFIVELDGAKGAGIKASLTTNAGFLIYEHYASLVLVYSISGAYIPARGTRAMIAINRLKM